MRKLFCCALMIITFFLFSGCGGNNLDQIVVNLTEQYQSIQQISAQAKVTADYGDRIVNFVLQYETGENGQHRVTVKEPESISGISATISEDLLSLHYENIVLASGNFSGLELSPMSVLPLVLSEIQSSFPSSYRLLSRDGKECVSLTYQAQMQDLSTEQITVFDKNTLFPLETAFYVEGHQVLTASFEQFSCH